MQFICLSVFELRLDFEDLLYCNVLDCDFRRGVGLGIGFNDHLNIKLIITLNYSAIANFHTL
jgi:hypothetical protein